MYISCIYTYTQSKQHDLLAFIEKYIITYPSPYAHNSTVSNRLSSAAEQNTRITQILQKKIKKKKIIEFFVLVT